MESLQDQIARLTAERDKLIAQRETGKLILKRLIQDEASDTPMRKLLVMLRETLYKTNPC